MLLWTFVRCTGSKTGTPGIRNTGLRDIPRSIDPAVKRGRGGHSLPLHSEIGWAWADLNSRPHAYQALDVLAEKERRCREHARPFGNDRGRLGSEGLPPVHHLG